MSRTRSEDNVSFERFCDAVINCHDNDVSTVERYIHANFGNPTKLNTVVDDKNNTALIWLANNGYNCLVTDLLFTPGIDINAINVYGNTALICAASQGHFKIVKALSKEPDINIMHQNNKHMTASQIAIREGYHDIFNFLVQREQALKNKSPILSHFFITADGNNQSTKSMSPTVTAAKLTP